MSERISTPMDTTEITDFLGSQETGVVSLANRSGRSYGFPISFVYEPDDRRIYFQFGYAGDSLKREFFETTSGASFVVHDETPDGWRSVVARGELAELLEPDVPIGVADRVNELDIPFFRVFEYDTDELEFTVVALDIDDLTGRIEAT